MKLSTLKGGTDSVWVTVPPEEEGGEEDKFEVKWKPGELTLGLYENLKEATSGPAPDLEALEHFLLPLLTWWDLDDDEGNNLPVNGESLMTIPIQYLSEMVNEIGKDSRPNAPRDATSEGASQHEEPQAASQSGTSSSEQQTDSDVEHGNSSNVQLAGTTSD